MIPIDNQFEYPTLKRVDNTPDGRVYSANGKLLPSVTTILQATQTEKKRLALESWRNRVGETKAAAILKEASGVGSVLHGYLETYMMHGEVKWGSNFIHKMATPMAQTIIEQGLPKLTKIYGIESNLYLENVYAGTADLIAEVNGKITIVDFKNTLKIKKEEYLEDYYIQLTAYSICHNSMFGTNIRDGKIMMCARPNIYGKCEYQEFDLTGEKFDKFEGIWLDRLDQYYSSREQ